MNEILSEIRALRQERLAEIDTDDDEEEEEEETPTSIIAGILKEPEMKAAILGLVANIATGLIKPAPVKQIAGVETDSIQKSIEILLRNHKFFNTSLKIRGHLIKISIRVVVGITIIIRGITRIRPRIKVSSISVVTKIVPTNKIHIHRFIVILNQSRQRHIIRIRRNTLSSK